jgi:CoA:oxalate CoA-transferase
VITHSPARAARMEEIDAMVEAWTRQRSKDDVTAALTRAHVPCAPVRTAGEVGNDPHLVELGM